MGGCGWWVMDYEGMWMVGEGLREIRKGGMNG